MSLIDGLGLVGDGLGIISFITDLVMPEDDPERGALITIKAGGDSRDDDPGMGGEISAAYAWDSEHDYLGQADGSDIELGDVISIKIDSWSGGMGVDYVGISAADDAVCVAYISVQQQDQAIQNGAWSGDIGYACGQHWYEQNQEAGELDGGEKYVPKCTWLDADHTGGAPSASLKFRVDAYGEKVKDTADSGTGCDSTLFAKDEGVIPEEPEKRSLRPRLPWMEDRLVISNRTQHKAASLCSSDKAWGPDFIGSDGMFCDMDTHTLYPLCSTDKIHGCVDIDDREMRITKRSFVAKRETETTHKTYKAFKNWG